MPATQLCDYKRNMVSSSNMLAKHLPGNFYRSNAWHLVTLFKVQPQLHECRPNKLQVYSE